MPQTQATGSNAHRLPKAVWIALALLVTGAYLLGLGFQLLGPDEPRYAQVAREMFERGDWITPTLGGHTWFEKPALLYWFEIVFYKVLGVNEYAARLGPALCGLGTVAALHVIGRTRGTHQRGALFAVVGASTLGILAFAHGASFDIVVTFPIAASIAAFRAYESGAKPRLSLILFYVFIGVALLAKGLIGIVFPIGIVGTYYVLSRRLPSLNFLLSLVWGTLIAAAVASIWYVPVYLQNGWTFVDEFFIQHHFQRFTSNKYQHPQPFYFYLWVLPLMTLPWLPVFLKGAWEGAKEVVNGGDADGERDLRALALAWVLVPLAFFSVSGSKLPGYILPAVPGAIVLVAVVLSGKFEESRRRRNSVLCIVAVTLFGGLIATFTLVPRFASDDSTKPLFAAAAEQGYSANRVLMLHAVSHNAEFYAAGRLERGEDGKLVEHFGSGEIATFLNQNGGSVLVLTPHEYVRQLGSDPSIDVREIARNRDLSLVAVERR